jgi:dolichol-phosphate mannosyltransferase
VDVADPTSGFFAARRSRLLAVDPEAHGFKILLEVLLKADEGLRVTEVPISFHDRERGKSKMGLRQVMSYLRRLMHTAWFRLRRALMSGRKPVS